MNQFSDRINGEIRLVNLNAIITPSRPHEVRITIIHPTGRSRVLGSQSESFILKTGERIRRIPHDVVHLGFSGQAESTSLNGLTPDIVTDSYILELVTRRTENKYVLQNAVTEKFVKYQHLGKPVLIMAVGLNLVICKNFTLSKENERVVLKNYHKGLSILDEYCNYNNYPEEGDDIKFNLPSHPRWCITEEGCLEETPHIKISKPFVKLEGHNYRTDMSPVSHLPLIYEFGEDSSPNFNGSTNLERFLLSGFLSSISQNETLHDYDTLNALQSLKQMNNRFQKKRDKPTNKDRIRLDRGSKDLEYWFAKRGVDGKHFRKRMDFIMERSKDREPFSHDVPCFDIQQYIRSRVTLLKKNHSLDHSKADRAKGF
jgi:hypothetical protein